MMKNHYRDVLLALGGAFLVGIGIFLLKTYTGTAGIMMTLPYLCVGVGCGVFGHGMGNVIAKRAMKSDPEMEKRREIEKNDERNVAIANKAKAKAYDLMIFVFGALLLSFALMSVNFVVVLLLVFVYLFIIFYAIYYRVKYEKEM